MTSYLKSLGMASAFDNRQADFSGIFPNPTDMAIDHVLHKATLDLDEEGTVAAAATSMSFCCGFEIRPRPFTMDINRPFFLAIRDTQTGLLLFTASITEP